MLGFDEINSRRFGPLKQGYHIGFGHGHTVRPYKATAPMIRTKGFGKTSGVDLDAAVGNHFEFQGLRIQSMQPLTQLLGIASTPMHKHVHPDQGFGFGYSSLVRFELEGLVPCVLGRLKMLGQSSQVLNDRLGKIGGADFLFAKAFGIDIGGVNTCFDGAEPRVLDSFSDLGFAPNAPT